MVFDRKIVRLLVHCHIVAPSPTGRRLNDKYPINPSHSSHISLNISLAVLFGGNGNTYTVSTQSGICIYTHFFTI